MPVAAPSGAAVTGLEVAAYEIPTDAPEEDGTLSWDSTTMIVVEAHAGGRTGLGFTYGDASVARLVSGKVAQVVEGVDAMDVPAAWRRMSAEVRNSGRSGVASLAISAVDCALWDLKARLLEVSLVELLGAAHETVPVYGSGGFTSYSLDRIASQLGGWVDQGIPRVKIKVGRRPEEDAARLDAARAAIGPDVDLFVDANGAWSRKQALGWAHRLAERWDVRWLEEPVSSDDLEGLRLLRDRGPGDMDVAAGEYAFAPSDLRLLLEAGAVDCLQADVTRCMGVTGMLIAGALCEAHALDLSGHCAPNLSVHALCAVPRRRHLEYFHDHVRIEGTLLDGALDPDGGALRPDRSRPGHGLELRRADAERFRVH